MKKILLSIIILSSALAVSGLVFFNISEKTAAEEQLIYDQIKKKEIIILSYGQSADIGVPKLLTLTKVKFEGHTYIIADGHGITHDPDCPCKD